MPKTKFNLHNEFDFKTLTWVSVDMPAVEDIDETNKISALLHYPECWDVAAYPTLLSAIQEIHRGCTECKGI